MGNIKHDAIVVTSWDMDMLTRGYNKAKKIGLRVSEIIESDINGYVSFLIVPDGSKEGWEDSYSGERKRADWIRWIRLNKGLYLDWIHIMYGGDDKEVAKIVDHTGNYDEEEP